MTRRFAALLRRYGRLVTLLPKDGGAALEGRAFLQPVAEKKERGRQFLPTELGEMRDERFLYLGDASLDLEQMALVCCDGVEYEIRTAQLVFLGREPSHWRGILMRREEAAAL